MKKYKIAIDISPISDGNSIRGVGYYTKHLTNALQRIKQKRFDIKLATQKSETIGADLIHYPFFDPFKLTLPNRTTVPTVVTVHDLIPRQFKSHFPVGIRGEIYWLIQSHRLKNIDHIITVSNYSKEIIHQTLHLSPQKISVTLEAANPDYHHINDKKRQAEIISKYNLPNKFVLYVGDINWNKNVPTLVKACLHQKIPLVIAGSAATKKTISHPWTQDILWVQSQKNKNLITTGFIDDNDMPVVYSVATVYCQPSYAEGFGLPVLEAMQCGCPVVTNRESSLAEVAGSAAIFFNPHSQSDLEDKLKEIYFDPTTQKKYSLLGIEQSQKFSWEKTAKDTLSVYDRVLHEKS